MFAALVAASYGAAYVKGRTDGWDKREAVAAAEMAEAERLSARLAASRARVTEKVVIRYRDRVRVVREKGEDVIREVEKLVPVGSCDLPAGWRLLHDAAASARPIPATSERANAAAVSAQDAALTVVSNYSTCHETAERLIALQQWTTQQHNLKE